MVFYAQKSPRSLGRHHSHMLEWKRVKMDVRRVECSTPVHNNRVEGSDTFNQPDMIHNIQAIHHARWNLPGNQPTLARRAGGWPTGSQSVRQSGWPAGRAATYVCPLCSNKRVKDTQNPTLSTVLAYLMKPFEAPEFMFVVHSVVFFLQFGVGAMYTTLECRGLKVGLQNSISKIHNNVLWD